QTDILGHLSRTGNWFFDQEKDFKVLKSMSAATNLKSVISIDASLYQNAGANIPQQLGYTLAALKEYLNIPSQKEEIPETFLPQFLVAAGSNYFFEIAKIRALRGLCRILAKENHLPEDCM